MMPHPTTYTPELGAEIAALRGAGLLLSEICANDGMPARPTIYLWLHRHADFAEMYDRAGGEWAEALGKESISIADAVHDKDQAVEAKSRIDARKWLADVVMPKQTLRPSKPGEKALPIPVNINLGSKPSTTI